MLLTAQQRLALVALAALMAAVALARREPTKPPQVVLSVVEGQEARKLPESPQGNALRDGHHLNPNLATAEELTLLPGIGPSLALRIVASRTQHGPFQSKADLRRVKGVGEKTLAKFDKFLRFDSEPIEHTAQSELPLENARDVRRRLHE